MPSKGLKLEGKQSSNGGEKIPTVVTGGVAGADTKAPAGDYYTGYTQPPPTTGFPPAFTTRPPPSQYPPAYPPAASIPSYYPPNTRPPY